MTTHSKAIGDIVLVALDGSPAAANALPVAHGIAAQLGATVEILHVRGVASGARADEAPMGQPGPDDAAVRELCGDPVAAILDAASDPSVALLVMTTHGRTIEPGRGLGRVAEAVVAAVDRPILLVRPEAPPRSADKPIRKMLAPLDGAPSTHQALKPITTLAARLRAGIDLLYVADAGQAPPGEAGTMTVPRYVDQPQHEWPQWATEAIARFTLALADGPADVPLHVYLAAGDVGDEVVRFASAHDEDAIALVRQSHLETGHGRVLRAILDHAPCSILLAPGAREDH